MSTELGGYMGQVLKVDLTTRETSIYPWSDEERRLYLGGKIMAARILYDTIAPGTDPLSAENVIVVSTGPLAGTGAPSSSRFNVSSLSPLTGFIASSNCGGNFGLRLKRAGYDALVITGASEDWLHVEITEDEVKFNDAGSLAGKTTSETQETLGGKRGKLVIGPAGENLVKFAGIFSQERAAGRAGLGAVMGAKRLKAVTAEGNKKPEIHAQAKMKKVYKSWVKLLKTHPLTGDVLPKLGSAQLLRKMQAHKVLATRNFKHGQFDDYDMVSGETLAEKRLTKNWGCVTCPIQCSRMVELNGKPVKGPELETLALLGPNLAINDLDKIIEWNWQLDELGMDTISTGNIIGFAMELQEQGLWDCGLEFGEAGNLAAIFDDIAYRRGIGDKLAEGTKRLAAEFGGEDFCINSKGLELAAYEPRGAVGQGLGYATANRGGCHLNAGYLVFMEGLGLNIDAYTPRCKAALTIVNQDLMEGVSAAGNCLFPLFSSTPAFLINHPNNPIARVANWSITYTSFFVNLFNKLPASFFPINLPMLPHSKAVAVVTGMKMHIGILKEVGERGFNLERMFNIKMGLTAKDDSLPKRLTDTPQEADNPKSRVPLEKMIGAYYSIRGWTSEGVPTDKKKRKLGLLA